MHRMKSIAIVASLALAVCTAAAQDTDRKVAGGGITVKGWTGKVDPAAAKQGKSINDSKLMQMGSDLHVAAGPACGLLESGEQRQGGLHGQGDFQGRQDDRRSCPPVRRVHRRQ